MARVKTPDMTRFSDYRPSQMMIEALHRLREARARLAQARAKQATRKREMLAHAEGRTRQPGAHTEGDDTGTKGGGQVWTGCRCGSEKK